MKHVTQRLRNGRIEVRDVPWPALAPDGVLVDVRASLVSAGTERSTVKAARSGLVGKARARPDQARQVLEKARRDGITSTIAAVRSRLEQPSALGYSSAGVVLEVGARVRDLCPGMRVACAGGGYAVHAEVNYVPGSLCVPLPDAVSFEAGAFATVGSIALHGVRQSEVHLGERVAVIGLGLVGQLACRLLRAAGCEVVAIDVDAGLVARARETSTPTAYVRSEVTPSHPPLPACNCDAIIITAATNSDDPIRLASALARDRARVVIVGDVGMNVPRAPFYGKELDLRLSRSYGPGRYDRAYEERGLDYPLGYVRWTERRNLSAFTQLLADGRVQVQDLITSRIPIEVAEEAYEKLLGDEISPLGILLTYGRSERQNGHSPRDAARTSVAASRTRAVPAVGVIGAGGFSQGVIIPGLSGAGFRLAMVASARGVSAVGAADRFGFERAVDPDELLLAEDLDAVCVASRHGTHAEYATRALDLGLAVFVEKPPALTFDELTRLQEAARGRVLQVGFNRRFAPLAQAARAHIGSGDQPMEVLYRVAAGPLADDHWLNDQDDGGGRLLGEGCHFVDFACWLMGGLPTHVSASIPDSPAPLPLSQRFAITLTFPGESIATVLYGSAAAPRLEKELIEIHSAGKSAVIHDFRRLELFGTGRPQVVRARGQDKGHRAQFVAFRRRLDGGSPAEPDPLATMAVTLEALTAAHQD